MILEFHYIVPTISSSNQEKKYVIYKKYLEKWI